MAPRQKEETAVNVLIGVLALIIIYLIARAFSTMGTALFAPLVIIVVLLILIAAALFYHSMLIRRLAEKKAKKAFSQPRQSKSEEAGSVAELEARLFGDIGEAMGRIKRK